MEDLLHITIRSLTISGFATLLAATWSIPLAYFAAVRPRVRVLAEAAEGLVGVPTVLIGLIVYMLFSRRGLLGFLGLLYTPTAIVIGEAVLPGCLREGGDEALPGRGGARPGGGACYGVL